jgi:hypothetical protein
MRTVIFIGILALSVSFLMGQTAEEEIIRLKQQTSGVILEEALQEEALQKGPDQEAKKPGHWNFSVGTSYSYMKGYGSGMMFYTAPTYTLSLDDRWSVHGGLIASRYQGMNYTMPVESLLPNSFSSLALFAAASYRMNDRLILHGTGVKQLVSGPVTPFTPYAFDDLSFGATYKLGNNFTIGASVHMNQRNGYYHSPWNSSPFASPFASPYPSPFGW